MALLNRKNLTLLDNSKFIDIDIFIDEYLTHMNKSNTYEALN